MSTPPLPLPAAVINPNIHAVSVPAAVPFLPSSSSSFTMDLSKLPSTFITILRDRRLYSSPFTFLSFLARQLRRAFPFLWRGCVLALLAYASYIVYRRRLLRQRRKKVERSYRLFGHSVRFGLDIGGTLCKVVYFEPDPSVPLSPSQALLRSRVSAFIRRSCCYGVTGRRDASLEVTCEQIHGTLHFLMFQTSMMKNFMTIVKENGLIDPNVEKELEQHERTTDNKGKDRAKEKEKGSRNNDDNKHAPAPNSTNVISSTLLADAHHHHPPPPHHHAPAHVQQWETAHQMHRSYSAAWRSEEQLHESLLAKQHEAAAGVDAHAKPEAAPGDANGGRSNENVAAKGLHQVGRNKAASRRKSKRRSSNSTNSTDADADVDEESEIDAEGMTTDDKRDDKVVPSGHVDIGGTRSLIVPPIAPSIDTEPESDSEMANGRSKKPLAPSTNILSPQARTSHSPMGSAAVPDATSQSRSSIEQNVVVAPPSTSQSSSSSPATLTPTAECSSASCPSTPLLSCGGHIHNPPYTTPANMHAHTTDPEALCLGRAAMTSATRPMSARHSSGATTRRQPSASFSAISPSPPPSTLRPATSRSSWIPPKRIIHPSPPTPFPPAVCATGGGAFKFEKLFRQQLHIRLHKEDELCALVKGIDFMIHTLQDECYFLQQYRFKAPIVTQVYPSKLISYPYLVVNIGSGVSILKVSGPHTFERVGGTSLGGGTFYGLCRALTGCTSFDDALEMAERGRSSHADLLVGDIYGGDYDEIGLPADTVAASFGKLVRGDALHDASKEDLAKAALVMITNNIGSIANLYARKVLNVPQMIFVGNFLTNNDVAKRGLAFATEYWSKGAAKALFLRHEGYFGAVGSMLG